MRRPNTVLYSSSRNYTGRIQRPDGLSVSSINWANCVIVDLYALRDNKMATRSSNE